MAHSLSTTKHAGGGLDCAVADQCCLTRALGVVGVPWHCSTQAAHSRPISAPTQLYSTPTTQWLGVASCIACLLLNRRITAEWGTCCTPALSFAMRSMCRPLLLAALGSLLSSTCTRALDPPGLSDFPPGAPSCKYTPPNLVRLPSPLPNSLQQAAAKVQNVSQSMLQAPYAPGVQVMAQYKDQTVLEHTAGSANVSSGLPVDPDTLFRIGSVSKLFPTILALQAAASGKIHLDDPLEAVAPDFIMYNPWGPSKVTWRLIMQQRSGLPRECPGGNTTASVLKNLEMYALTYPPGEAPSYSNLGFALMGHLLAERVLGLDFPAAVDKFIISPLGLNNTGFT